MTILDRTIFVLSATLWAIGCSSGGPQSSSSSHWATCATDADCAGVAGDAQCQQGYCVDVSGSRLLVENTQPLGPCDPFAGGAITLQLEGLIGAGRAADGTLYVADESSEGEARVFIGTGDVLSRVEIGGAASNATAERTETAITFNDRAGAAFTLLIAEDTSMGTLLELWLAPGELREWTFPPDNAEALTPIESQELSRLTFAGERSLIVEYHALLENDDSLVVLRPGVDGSYEDFRLFLGRGSAEERAVSSVTRAKDGGSTRIVFDFDGRPSEAHFPFGGQPTLTVDESQSPLRLASTLAEPVALPESYQCLTQATTTHE